jgi:hypothetical protein
MERSFDIVSVCNPESSCSMMDCRHVYYLCRSANLLEHVGAKHRVAVSRHMLDRRIASTLGRKILHRVAQWIFILILAGLMACSQSATGVPFTDIDLITVGGYQTKTRGEITDSLEIARLVNFANERRSREWSCCGNTLHGQGGLLVFFYSRGTFKGYFGVQSSTFFTSLERGDAALKPSSHQEILDFVNLVPASLRTMQAGK